MKISWSAKALSETLSKIRLPKLPRIHVLLGVFGASIIVSLTFLIIALQQGQLKQLTVAYSKLEEQAGSYREELGQLKREDQYLVNQKLKEEIANIHRVFGQAVSSYEELVKLREKTRDTGRLDSLLAESLSLLAEQNWTTASAKLASLAQGMSELSAKLAAAAEIPANVPSSNAPPGSGFSRQSVKVDGSNFLVSIVAADLASARVIVDTASERDCTNDCPTLALGDYVSRNGAYAGVNGSYFCPAEYPSCSGKKNSFDTLLMNKNKVYFNSDNNVYSTVPAVIFLGGSVRFVGQSLEWGRDTSPDGVIANRPLLVMGGNLVFTGEGEPKEGNKGNRSFVANRGNTVYIGVVHSASVAESAKVMQALGMENALNLDDGGSTALWSGGYKVGPGRNLPNAILFVRK